MKKIIVSVAPVAANTQIIKGNPLTPEEIADDVINCTRAGASIVHLHVRDRNGDLTCDLTEFSRTLDLIRKRSDIIIQGSTGGVSSLTLEERCAAVYNPYVEIASLNMGSANFDDGVYINTMRDIRYWAGRMKEKGVKPELEIFEGGMVNNSVVIAAEGLIDPGMVFAFCLGFKGALQANTYNIEFLRGMLPQGSIWGLVHHGMEDFSLLASAIGIGASFVRVGFEDSMQYGLGKTAVSNSELVERIVSLIRIMGYNIASPAETREILGINNVKQIKVGEAQDD